MRKLISYALAVAALALPALPTRAAQALPSATAATAMAQDFNSCGYYPKSALRLRTGPGTKYTTLGVLYPADLVSVDKAKGGWYRVSLQDRSKSGLKAGSTGWVAKSGLKPHVCMQLDVRQEAP
ncbi:SH3 domain-containing protein [Streptomyces sp. NBC_01142]|uniref:SH3 domain-containing protein n=1 Tax=Streptomyces sp. NBC_01142 TaxID=2975865 RepID=UPI0022572C68|nr:SH3 domain-containing protein [Streptomyces sp. NBC_01142]MCX4826182.1 SH3 domain-containing protein [Streptomyces sp. NBC_01142]